MTLNGRHGFSNSKYADSNTEQEVIAEIMVIANKTDQSPVASTSIKY